MGLVESRSIFLIGFLLLTSVFASDWFDSNFTSRQNYTLTLSKNDSVGFITDTFGQFVGLYPNASNMIVVYRYGNGTQQEVPWFTVRNFTVEGNYTLEIKGVSNGTYHVYWGSTRGTYDQFQRNVSAISVNWINTGTLNGFTQNGGTWNSTQGRIYLQNYSIYEMELAYYNWSIYCFFNPCTIRAEAYYTLIVEPTNFDNGLQFSFYSRNFSYNPRVGASFLPTTETSYGWLAFDYGDIEGINGSNFAPSQTHTEYTFSLSRFSNGTNCASQFNSSFTSSNCGNESTLYPEGDLIVFAGSPSEGNETLNEGSYFSNPRVLDTGTHPAVVVKGGSESLVSNLPPRITHLINATQYDNLPVQIDWNPTDQDSINLTAYINISNNGSFVGRPAVFLDTPNFQNTPLNGTWSAFSQYSRKCESITPGGEITIGAVQFLANHTSTPDAGSFAWAEIWSHNASENVPAGLLATSTTKQELRAITKTTLISDDLENGLVNWTTQVGFECEQISLTDSSKNGLYALNATNPGLGICGDIRIRKTIDANLTGDASLYNLSFWYRLPCLEDVDWGSSDPAGVFLQDDRNDQFYYFLQSNTCNQWTHFNRNLLDYDDASAHNWTRNRIKLFSALLFAQSPMVEARGITFLLDDLRINRTDFNPVYNFTPALPLHTDQTYWSCLTTNDTSNGLTIFESEGSAYTDGIAAEGNGTDGSWSSSSENDLWFKIWDLSPQKINLVQGNYTVTMFADDGELTNTTTFDLTVLHKNVPPSITQSTGTTQYDNIHVQIDWNLADSDSQNLTSVIMNVSWANNGSFVGTPTVFLDTPNFQNTAYEDIISADGEPFRFCESSTPSSELMVGAVQFFTVIGNTTPDNNSASWTEIWSNNVSENVPAEILAVSTTKQDVSEIGINVNFSTVYNFSQPAALHANSTYWFCITTNDTQSGFSQYGSTLDPYAGGMAGSGNGTTGFWNNYTSLDFWFRVWDWTPARVNLSAADYTVTLYADDGEANSSITFNLTAIHDIPPAITHTINATQYDGVLAQIDWSVTDPDSKILSTYVNISLADDGSFVGRPTVFLDEPNIQHTTGTAELFDMNLDSPNRRVCESTTSQSDTAIGAVQFLGAVFKDLNVSETAIWAEIWKHNTELGQPSYLLTTSENLLYIDELGGDIVNGINFTTVFNFSRPVSMQANQTYWFCLTGNDTGHHTYLYFTSFDSYPEGKMIEGDPRTTSSADTGAWSYDLNDDLWFRAWDLSPQKINLSAGNYTVTMFADDGIATNTTDFNITVLSTAQPQIGGWFNTTFNRRQNITFTIPLNDSQVDFRYNFTTLLNQGRVFSNGTNLLFTFHYGNGTEAEIPWWIDGNLGNASRVLKDGKNTVITLRVPANGTVSMYYDAPVYLYNKLQNNATATYYYATSFEEYTVGSNLNDIYGITAGGASGNVSNNRSRSGSQSYMLYKSGLSCQDNYAYITLDKEYTRSLTVEWATFRNNTNSEPTISFGNGTDCSNFFTLGNAAGRVRFRVPSLNLDMFSGSGAVNLGTYSRGRWADLNATFNGVPSPATYSVIGDNGTDPVAQFNQPLQNNSKAGIHTIVLFNNAGNGFLWFDDIRVRSYNTPAATWSVGQAEALDEPPVITHTTATTQFNDLPIQIDWHVTDSDSSTLLTYINISWANNGSFVGTPTVFLDTPNFRYNPVRVTQSAPGLNNRRACESATPSNDLVIGAVQFFGAVFLETNDSGSAIQAEIWNSNNATVPLSLVSASETKLYIDEVGADFVNGINFTTVFNFSRPAVLRANNTYWFCVTGNDTRGAAELFYAAGCHPYSEGAMVEGDPGNVTDTVPDDWSVNSADDLWFNAWDISSQRTSLSAGNYTITMFADDGVDTTITTFNMTVRDPTISCPA